MRRASDDGRQLTMRVLVGVQLKASHVAYDLGLVRTHVRLLLELILHDAVLACRSRSKTSLIIPGRAFVRAHVSVGLVAADAPE